MGSIKLLVNVTSQRQQHSPFPFLELKKIQLSIEMWLLNTAPIHVSTLASYTPRPYLNQRQICII